MTRKETTMYCRFGRQTIHKQNAHATSAPKLQFPMQSACISRTHPLMHIHHATPVRISSALVCSMWNRLVNSSTPRVSAAYSVCPTPSPRPRPMRVRRMHLRVLSYYSLHSTSISCIPSPAPHIHHMDVLFQAAVKQWFSMQGAEKTMGLAVHFPSKTFFATRYQVRRRPYR